MAALPSALRKFWQKLNWVRSFYSNSRANRRKDMTKFRIPLAQPDITDADRDAVLQVLRTSDLSFGPKLTEFENAIASDLQVNSAVAVNSGTSGLHLALRVLDIPPHAEVILPSFAFAAPLNVLLQENLCPVFVDIDPDTLNTTPELVEAAITPKTKAIIAIHTFGRPVDAKFLRDLADRREIYLIEDACEALGTQMHGRKAGSFGTFPRWRFIRINKSRLEKAGF